MSGLPQDEGIWAEVEGEVKERGVWGPSGSVGSIKFIRSPISCFIARGWEPTDGADKPENFSSIAGSFNIAPSGTSLKNYKVEIKRGKIVL